MDEYVSIATPDHVTLDFELAGLGSRLAAMILDHVIIVLLLIGIGVAMALGDLLIFSSATPWITAFMVIVSFLVFWGYFVFFETIMSGQTPGKRATGIRVVRETGLPIGLREAALRNLVRLADMLPPPAYLLGGIVASADRRGRRLGDMAAGTIVVRERFEMAVDFASGAAWAERVERGQSRNAVTLPRGSISPSQLGVIEQFLRRRAELPLDRRAELAWQIAEPLLEMVGEDRAAIAADRNRGRLCERVLTAILDMARATKRIVAVAAAAPEEPKSLF